MSICVLSLGPCVHVCVCLPACMFVRAVWRLMGVRGETDGSWSGLVWCSLPAKDQAKTVTALCTSFSPAWQSKITHLFLFYRELTSFQNVVVLTAKITFITDFVLFQYLTMNAWFCFLALRCGKSLVERRREACVYMPSLKLHDFNNLSGIFCILLCLVVSMASWACVSCIKHYPILHIGFRFLTVFYIFILLNFKVLEN